MEMFELHPDLKCDCLFIGDLPLCRLLLMNNRLFPWLILVPRKEGLKDLIDLNPPDMAICMEEARRAGEALKTLYKPDKLNIAALGNVTLQLHLHVIARFKNDAAWPQPVWGRDCEAYSQTESLAAIKCLNAALNLG